MTSIAALRRPSRGSPLNQMIPRSWPISVGASAWPATGNAECHLSRRRLQGIPDQPGLYRIVTSLRFYLDGRYKEALAEIEKANIPSVIHYHVILAMAHAQLGQMKQADAEVKEVLKIDPAYGENAIADLREAQRAP